MKLEEHLKLWTLHCFLKSSFVKLLGQFQIGWTSNVKNKDQRKWDLKIGGFVHQILQPFSRYNNQSMKIDISLSEGL